MHDRIGAIGTSTLTKTQGVPSNALCARLCLIRRFMSFVTYRFGPMELVVHYPEISHQEHSYCIIGENSFRLIYFFRLMFLKILYLGGVRLLVFTGQSTR